MWRAICSVTALVLLFSLTATGQRLRVESFEGREVVSGEVLVRFRDAGAPQAVALAAQDTDIISTEQVGRAGVVRLRSRGRNVSALLRAYRQRFDVLYAEPNYIWRARDFPNDEFAGRQWALRNTGQEVEGQVGTVGADIGAVPAWSITEGSRSIVVGVLDGGIDYDHPDLAQNVWSAPAPFSVVIGGQVINCAAGTHGFNAIKRTCDPRDEDGHGTHVAGVIGAAGNNGLGVSGVSRIASVMALKFLDSRGVGTTADAVAALEFAFQVKAIFPTAANVRILNNSWGNGNFSQALLDEVNLANANNILFVAASGNESLNNDLVPIYPGNFKVANVVSVAATDNQDRLAEFSNWGPTTVHLGAPGVGILSTVPLGPHRSEDGTSMSTPLVAGAAALVLSSCPLTTAALKTVLLENVDPIPALAGRTTTGGRLNVFRALSACAGTTAGFDLTVSPGTRQLELMQPSAFEVTVTGTNGFNAPVDLTVVGVPGGMTATLTSSSIFGGSGSSTLTLTAGNTVEAGTYLIGIHGSGGGRERTSGVAVTVGFPINPGETISGQLTPGDAPSPEAPNKFGDLFKLTLTSVTDITIDLKSRVFDPFLYVRASTGEILFSDDDSGLHGNSRIQGTFAPGTYSVEVSSREAGDAGLYTLSVNTPTLTDIVPFVAAPGSAITLTLTGERFVAPMTIDVGSDITITNVDVVNSTAATATLSIASGAANTPRNLTARTSEGPSNPLTFTIPLPINVGGRVMGTLSNTDQTLVNRSPYRHTDIYQLSLAANTAVTLDLLSDEIDTELYLLSSAGVVLFEDNDGGFDTDARITATLAAGVYFIEATSHNKLETGAYALSVNSPTLESINPTFLAVGNINNVVLTGTRFSGVATVDAGSGITVSNVVVTNSTTINARFTVSATAEPGSRNIKVTTPDGTSNGISFRVVPAIPAIGVGARLSGTLLPTDPESMVIPGSHADLFRFTLGSAQFVVIDLVTNAFEGHLALLSSSGSVIELSEDEDGDGSTQIFGTFPSGTYFIEVSSVNPMAAGSYTVGFDTVFISSITPLFGQQGTIVDLFFTGRFLTAPLTIEPGPGITVSNVTLPNTLGGSARLDISLNAPLGVRKIMFSESGGTDYFLFAVVPLLPPITHGQTVSGTLAGGDQAALSDFFTYGDLHSVTISAGGSGAVEVNSPDFEVRVADLSPAGEILSESVGHQARLTGLGPGTHFIEVSSVLPNIGTYTLSVLAAPTLSAISPGSAPRGTTFGMTFTGSNFSSPMTVAVAGIMFSNVTVYSPTFATAVVSIPGSASLGVRNVFVTTVGGVSATLPLNVTAGNLPTHASRLSFTRLFAPSELTGTGVAVVNPGPSAAEVEFKRYNSSGVMIGFYAETVGARSQMARLGSELFPGTTQSGWIEVTSITGGLQGFWLDGDFKNVMDGSTSAVLARELIFPLVTAPTEVTIVSSTSNSATIRIYDANGTELGIIAGLVIVANGALQFSVGATFPTVNMNNGRYLRVTGTADLMGTTITKDFPASPSWVVLNGSDSSVLSTDAYFPHVPSGGGWISVAGITNLSTSPQIVTLTYYPTSGSSVSVIRNLAGRGSIRESADDLFGFAGSTQDGWVKVTGTLPLTGYVVYGYGPAGGSAAVPVQDTPRTSMIFSHVATGPQFETGLALLNTTSRDANVEVYIMRRTGALVGGAADVLTASFTLRAGTKLARLLSEFVPASINDDGFVFVRSTNDVPLYAFELFFTRDVKVIANVPAGILPAGVSYSPPAPASPLPPLTISSLSPATAPVGTVITINGSGFDVNAANTVVFTTAASAVSVPAVSATSTTLTAAIPAGAVTGPVFFTTGGRFSNSVTLTVP